jgi:hypothetical protein
MEEIEITTETLSQDLQSPGQDSNPEPVRYKTRVARTRPRPRGSVCVDRNLSLNTSPDAGQHRYGETKLT